jgi:hypothetical protein
VMDVAQVLERSLETRPAAEERSPTS